MALSWAGRRKALVITLLGAVALAVIAVLAFSILYETPTCTDRKQNQDEAGVDCGGSCTTLCRGQAGAAPVVRFVRPFSPQPGRTDVIAYIDNPNANAASRNAPFSLEVYGTDRQLIAKRSIAVDLPPAATAPLYLPDVAPRGTVAAQAFLTFDTERAVWSRVDGPRPVLPAVEGLAVTEGPMPRVTATLTNPLAQPFRDLILIATAFDSSGTAIAASQTLVPLLPPQGSAPLVFTWNAPFSAPNPRVEILPVQEVGIQPVSRP
jgi:hypothetical protein